MFSDFHSFLETVGAGESVRLIDNNPNNQPNILRHGSHDIMLHHYFYEVIKGLKAPEDIGNEIFAEVYSTAFDGCNMNEICYFFPRTSVQAQGIHQALESLAEEEREAAIIEPALIP